MMASLPSVSLNSTFKLESEIRKYPFTEKGAIVAYPNNQSNSLSLIESASDKRFLEFTGATHIESSFYVPLLQDCIKKSSVSDTQAVHAHIVKTGTHQDVFVNTFLVNVYAKCDHMEDAQKLFDQLPQRNVVTWTALMTGYARNSQPLAAVRAFIKMLQVGPYPTSYTFGTLLSACSSHLLVNLGKQIHGYIVKYGVESEADVGNSLCSFYTKCRSLDSAIGAFCKIGEKNVISWTTVISACGDNGEPEMGLRYFIQMLSEDVELNEFTFTTILSLCCTVQAMEIGKQIHSMSIKSGYNSTLPVQNSIMYLYLKCGLVDEANMLFNGMDTTSPVAWNAMIAGLAQAMDHPDDDISAYHRGNEALAIFAKMNGSGLRPDLYTLSSILTVCSKLAAIEQGEQVHSKAIKSGYLSDVVVGTALVDMYNKCGRIEKAGKAFVEMPTRTLISWTSMITAFAHHGRPRLALELFEDMRMTGEKPNKVTFVGVLSACSHAGFIDDGLRYFEMMKNQYKIKPIMNHYACLIDMFVRSGRLEEAFDIAMKMGCEPSEFIWSILIAGCRRHGNLELGFYAAEQILKLKPRDTETYIILLNMYMSVGRWQDVSRVRKLMKEEKLGKLNDWSWMSVKDKIYSFRPDHRLHPPNTELEIFLQNLLGEAKSMGYRPLHLVLNEDGDENATTPSSSLLRHSEKLAVAFGLLKTPPAAPLRIVKNTSMCSDCHNFLNLVSTITSREIIIRDSKRMHRFVNGHCSCGDFSNLI